MTTTGAARFSNALGLLAATLYLATFLVFAYGVYQFTRGEPFLDSIAAAYPLALACSLVLFLCCAIVEALKATVKRVRNEGKHASVHSLAHR